MSSTTPRLLALSLAILSGACSDSGSGSAQSSGGTGGSGATSGTGGSGATSGTGGSGASAGSGGSAGSPGSVTLKFEVPSAKSYCQQGECGASSSVVIKDASGKALMRYPGDCYTPCDTCQALPCPGYACQPQGYAITGETFDWDGTYYAQNTCGGSTSCLAHSYAQPGKYTAVMCATPGTLAPDANQVDQCTATGPAECVEVPFDFPTDKTVTGTLPG